MERRLFLLVLNFDDPEILSCSSGVNVVEIESFLGKTGGVFEEICDEKNNRLTFYPSYN